MVVTTSGLNQEKQIALDYFDKYFYMAIGSGTSNELVSDTALGTEEVREKIDTRTKGSSTFDYEADFELSDAAGDTITEAGIFDLSSNGEMGFRKKLPVSVSKTSAEELIIKLRVTVTATNG